MRLLIDAGNTRIKWAITNGGNWLDRGVLSHDRIDALEPITLAHDRLRGVLGTNVAGDAVAQRIAAALAPAGLQATWLRPSERRCGVINLYETPSQLGADRWAALIGARARHKGPCLVVSAGTATTIDLLLADGRFAGGLILPGEYLMRKALSRDTAQLPLAEGEAREEPRNTIDAIVTGCLYAQAGAIERMYRRIASQADALCLLAGGAAARIQPLLEFPCQLTEDLVLQGLARVATEDDPSCSPAS